MPTKRVAAPPNPGAVRAARMDALVAKANRTPAETNELLSLLVGEVSRLRAPAKARPDGPARAGR